MCTLFMCWSSTQLALHMLGQLPLLDKKSLKNHSLFKLLVPVIHYLSPLSLWTYLKCPHELKNLSLWVEIVIILKLSPATRFVSLSLAADPYWLWIAGNGRRRSRSYSPYRYNRDSYSRDRRGRSRSPYGRGRSRSPYGRRDHDLFRRRRERSLSAGSSGYRR